MTAAPPGSLADRRQELGAIARALRRESHVLRARPALLGQQVANRVRPRAPSDADDLGAQIAGRAERARPDRRTWLSLRTDVHESDALLRTLTGHDGEVSCCCFAPASALVLSGSVDWTARTWDPMTGASQRVLVGHHGPIEACAVAPDGTVGVTASADRTLKVWDLATGEEVRTLAGHADAVAACAFGPDGTFVLSGSRDGTARIWHLASEVALQVLDIGDAVSSCAVSPDGQVLATAAMGVVQLWDRRIASRMQDLLGHDGAVTSTSFSPDGSHLLTTGWDGSIRLWRVSDGVEVRTVVGDAIVSSAVFSGDGALVAASSVDGTTRIWDLATARTVAVLEGHAGAVERCDATPDFATIVTAADDRTLKLWDVRTARRGGAPSSPDALRQVRFAAFARDGMLLAVTGRSARLVHPDHPADDGEACASDLPVPITACDFDPDAGVLAVGSTDGALVIQGTRPPSTVRRVHVGDVWVTACALGPGGQPVAAGARDGAVHVWRSDHDDGHEVLARHDERVTCCAFSPDGSRLVSGSWDETLTVWDVASGRPVAVLGAHEDRVTACAFSPDGRRIASTSDDGTLRLWDATTGEPLRSSLGHDGPVRACCFSGDGSLVASGGADHAIVVWDARSGEEVARYVGLGPMSSVRFDPSGRRLAATDTGGALHILELVGPGRVLAGDVIEPLDETMPFYPFDLLHKFGFGDGDMLEELMEEHHLDVDRSDLLATVVEQLVVPRLDQQVETYRIVSWHNPIRASTVDGEPADVDAELTPETVAVRVRDILAIARTLPPRASQATDAR